MKALFRGALLGALFLFLSGCQVHTVHRYSGPEYTYRQGRVVEAPAAVIYSPYRRPMVRTWDPYWRQWVYK